MILFMYRRRFAILIAAIVIATLVSIMFMQDAAAFNDTIQNDYVIGSEQWTLNNSTFSNATGTPIGSIKTTCSSTGLGCTTYGENTIQGTWHSLFGIPTSATVTSFSASTEVYTAFSGAGNKYIDIELKDVSDNRTLGFPMQLNSLGTGAQTDWQPSYGDSFDMLPEYGIGSNEIKLLVHPTCRIVRNSIGTCNLWYDKTKITFSYTMNSQLLAWIPIANAATECTMSTIDNTTTATCTDPMITIPTQDYFFGLLLFIAGFVISFIAIRARRKGVNT